MTSHQASGGVSGVYPAPRRRLPVSVFPPSAVLPVKTGPVDRGAPRSGAVPGGITEPGRRNGLTNAGRKHSLAETQEPYGAYGRQSAARTEAKRMEPTHDP